MLKHEVTFWLFTCFIGLLNSDLQYLHSYKHYKLL